MIAALLFFGYSAVIKTCFLLNYTWMSAQSETMTISLMYLLTSWWVAACTMGDLVFMVHHNTPIEIPYLSGEESIVGREISIAGTLTLVTFTVMAICNFVALAAKVWR